MNSIRRLFERFKSGSRPYTGLLPLSVEEKSLMADRLEAILSTRFGPTRVFVDSLEHRLRQAAETHREQSPRLAFRFRHTVLVWVSVAMAVAGGIIGGWALFSNLGGQSRVPLAYAMSQAYDDLLSVKTVRYTVNGKLTPGSFGTKLDASLTDEELMAMDPGQRPTRIHSG